jgi:hypothetical protein
MSLGESYYNFPNPFAAGRESTTFAFYLPVSGRVTLRLLTLRGEEVLTLADNKSYAGPGLIQELVWDGRNGRDDTVLNGVYVAELRVDLDDGSSERVLRKVAVVR